MESLGFPAVATSSWAIASSLGYRDGERVSREQMLQVVARIASAVSIPVSADMEAGYAETPGEMAETTRQLIAAGAVGLNLEDGKADRTRLVPLDRQLSKIEALRNVAISVGVPLVLNARTDALWWKGADPQTRWADTIQRANAYRLAGADCIFVPGLRIAGDIARFVQESPGPLNILGGAGAPSIAELRRLGVIRVSVGPGAYRAALGHLRKLANEMRDQGTYSSLTDNAVTPEEVNRWFA
jgi:2-methylisocitrate lyase-like PEP mutase family enzyme